MHFRLKAGPTTAYPCRIRYCPDKPVPELSLSVDYLMKLVDLIRVKMASLRADPSSQVTLKKLGFELTDEATDNLKDIEQANFQVPSFVTGDTEVLKTVCHLS